MGRNEDGDYVSHWDQPDVCRQTHKHTHKHTNTHTPHKNPEGSAAEIPRIGTSDIEDAFILVHVYKDLY